VERTASQGKAVDPSGTGKAWTGLERKAPQSRGSLMERTGKQRIAAQGIAEERRGVDPSWRGTDWKAGQGTGMDLNLTWF